MSTGSASSPCRPGGGQPDARGGVPLLPRPPPLLRPTRSFGSPRPTPHLRRPSPLLANSAVLPGGLWSLTLPVRRLYWGRGKNQEPPLCGVRVPGPKTPGKREDCSGGEGGSGGLRRTTSQRADLTSLGRALGVLPPRDSELPGRVLRERAEGSEDEGFLYPPVPGHLARCLSPGSVGRTSLALGPSPPPSLLPSGLSGSHPAERARGQGPGARA